MKQSILFIKAIAVVMLGVFITSCQDGIEENVETTASTNVVTLGDTTLELTHAMFVFNTEPYRGRYAHHLKFNTEGYTYETAVPVGSGSELALSIYANTLTLEPGTYPITNDEEDITVNTVWSMRVLIGRTVQYSDSGYSYKTEQDFEVQDGALVIALANDGYTFTLTGDARLWSAPSGKTSGLTGFYEGDVLELAD